MATPILGLNELADGQIDQFLAVNENSLRIEDASNASIAVDLSAGDYTLTAAEFAGYFLFQSTGNAVSRTLTVPQSIRIFAVLNGGSATLNIARGTTTLTIAAGKTRIYHTDGTANGLVLLDLT